MVVDLSVSFLLVLVSNDRLPTERNGSFICGGWWRMERSDSRKFEWVNVACRVKSKRVKPKTQPAKTERRTLCVPLQLPPVAPKPLLCLGGGFWPGHSVTVSAKKKAGWTGHLSHTHSLHSRAARAQRGATPPPPDKKRDWSYSRWQRSLDLEAQQCIHTKKKGKEEGEKKKRKENSYPAKVKGDVFWKLGGCSPLQCPPASRYLRTIGR